MKIIQFILFLFVPMSIVAQDGPNLLRFEPSFGEVALALDKNYFLEGINDSVRIDKLQFYIGGIQLSKNEAVIYDMKEEHFLIDLNKPNSLTIALDTHMDFDEIVFNIGVDSLLSEDGAHGGDLDPMYGMYWAWQSGYINFKLEGTSPSCDSRKNQFQYHIGGFLAPNNAQRTIRLKAVSSMETVVNLPIDELLHSIDISKIQNVMSPGDAAIQIADQFPLLIQIKE